MSDLSTPITTSDSPSTGVDSLPNLKPRDGLSYVVGDRRVALLDKTISQLLRETVKQFGTREAVIFPSSGIRWTYTDFASKVDDLASGLLALGFEKGDRIAIWSPNRVEWVTLQFASARIGLILVTINPAYRLAELEYALNKVSCKALLLASNFKSSNYLEMIQALAPELENCEPGKLEAVKLPHLKTVIRMGSQSTPGMINYDAVLSLGGPAQRNRLDGITNSLDPDDPINIQFTSGTTGSPKGATLTHANIVNNGHNVVATMGFTEQDRLCIPVPLYHCFGMVMGSLGCASVGAAMIFPGEAFEPEPTLKVVQDERCTALYGVPTMFVAQLELPEFSSFDLSSLRTGIMAGAPCPIAVMKRVIVDMNMQEVTIAYGMTETSPVSFQSHTDDPIERRVSTVGRIHPHVEVKIVNDAGLTVPVGEQGELYTRGYSVMLGYWGDQEKTSDSIDSEGWMRTGDLATIDEQGYCDIVGRVKDMLIRGGENIYPREIENYLHRFPKIQDVQVFGVPDEKYGEEICAWVILKEGEVTTEEEIKDFCRGQIAHYKIPRYIRMKTEFPMTVTGKIQKFVMREMMCGELF